MSSPTRRPQAGSETEVEPLEPGATPGPAAEEKRREGDAESAESEALDEALDETFPASDPPAIIAPHHRPVEGGDE